MTKDAHAELVAALVRKMCEALGIDPARVADLSDDQIAELTENVNEWLVAYEAAEDEEQDDET